MAWSARPSTVSDSQSGAPAPSERLSGCRAPTVAPDWMSKGYYPLCQTRPPAVYDHNAHMSWEVETEQQFTDPITRQPAYYIAVGRVLPQTVSQQLCEGPPL